MKETTCWQCGSNSLSLSSLFVHYKVYHTDMYNMATYYLSERGESPCPWCRSLIDYEFETNAEHADRCLYYQAWRLSYSLGGGVGK